jgi:hypothetical protein
VTAETWLVALAALSVLAQLVVVALVLQIKVSVLQSRQEVLQYIEEHFVKKEICALRHQESL